MNKIIKKWFIIGSIFSLVFGTLLHFVFEWSNYNSLVGIFSPINESTWEHLKLLLWPGFIFMIIEYFLIGYKYNNYIVSKVISLLIGMSLIVILFYTYTGIIGRNNLVVDISIFVLSVIITQYIGYKLIISIKKFTILQSIIAIIILVIIIMLFTIFTFTPPKIPLFADPRTGKYGI